MMESERVQCRKCRKLLLSKDEFCLLDAHSQEYHDTMGNMNGQSSGDCASVMEHSCLYLSEESFPDFILKAVNESSWTKGKIHCPGCQARLGSFNFVSGSQCACGSHILPQVHILKSKVDWRKIGEALPNPVSFPDRAVVLSSITLPLDANTSTRTQQGAAGSEAAASNVSGENNSKKCSPAELTALESILSDLAVTDKSLKPRSESCKRVGTGKFEEPLRHKHLPKEVGVRQLSETVMVSNADLPVSSHFEVLAEQELTEEEANTDEEESVPEYLMCPVCLDMLYSPLVAQPCGHKFCEPCLRRLARPNPTCTQCPLCRQIIGQCMPCPELAAKVRENFSELYTQRREFENQHNSHHLPLPWNKNFRWRQIHQDGRSWVERAGGWRTVMCISSIYILGIGIWLYLGNSGKLPYDYHVLIAGGVM